jgi:hypothetical protein
LVLLGLEESVLREVAMGKVALDDVGGGINALGAGKKAC